MLVCSMTSWNLWFIERANFWHLSCIFVLDYILCLALSSVWLDKKKLWTNQAEDFLLFLAFKNVYLVKNSDVLFLTWTMCGLIRDVFWTQCCQKNDTTQLFQRKKENNHISNNPSLHLLTQSFSKVKR